MSSELSLDGSNFDHLDDASDTMSLQNLDLQSNHLSLDTSHYNLHHNNNNNNLSCIDKLQQLCQMQNSYFIGTPVEQ